MAEAAGDHTSSEHTVGKLFQHLVDKLGWSSVDAKKKIESELCRGRPKILMHLAGGARRLLRSSMPEEREAADKALKEGKPWSWDYLYEIIPPGGRTELVAARSWERERHLFWLEFKDGSLVIEFRCALDFRWEAYSFTVADWDEVINDSELWPKQSESQPVAPTSSFMMINLFGSTSAAAPLAAAVPPPVPASKSEEVPAPAQPTQESRRPTKLWVPYAIEQKRDELAGLGVQPAAKRLEQWMKDGLYSPEKVVGWKRIKNIAIENNLLPIKAPVKRP